MIESFTKDELKILKKLNTPKKIQDFLDAIPVNFEPNGDTCMSPRRVLRENIAHCMEGAMLAAAALRIAGWKPLVIDLKSNNKDYDHVVAVYQINGHWGALSKTNHPVLRFREPVYKSIRELAMTYFHEYYLGDGVKTLRSYSVPVDLSKLDKHNWMTSEEDVWVVPNTIEDARHIPMLTKSQIMGLRLADDIERRTGTIEEWKDPAAVD